MQEHQLQVKIYLEDTDAQGIVYHANYLKYCERCRTDMLAGNNGPSLGQWQARGYLFVVHELHIKYKVPAHLHDVLLVKTTLERTSNYRLTFKHDVRRQSDDTLLVQVEAIVVAVSNEGQLRELPEGLLIG
ncbi:MAG: YbgC/FadM family acyl-CoA thioesterase [Deltaproteobacteria bacterium]|nr:YbgC/FadM family acyl-CoA thioesterase [Deltaproteobacteria bacterium]